MTDNSTYDLVLRGGRVIDPAHGRDGVMDVALAGGRVAAMGARLLDGRGRGAVGTGDGRFLRASGNAATLPEGDQFYQPASES